MSNKKVIPMNNNQQIAARWIITKRHDDDYMRLVKYQEDELGDIDVSKYEIITLEVNAMDDLVIQLSDKSKTTKIKAAKYLNQKLDNRIIEWISFKKEVVTKLLLQDLGSKIYIIKEISLYDYEKDIEPDKTIKTIGRVDGHVEIQLKHPKRILEDKYDGEWLIAESRDADRLMRKGYIITDHRTFEHGLLNYRSGNIEFGVGVKEDDEIIWAINDMVCQLNETDNTNFISDGQHTFGDLYYHRAVLTSVIARMVAKNMRDIDASTKIDLSRKRDLIGICSVIKSMKHDDGTMFDGYFIVQFNTPAGQFSYHYPLDYWDMFKDVVERKQADKYDGHTAEDITRLFGIADLLTGEV